jgi:putative membrane protein
MFGHDGGMFFGGALMWLFWLVLIVLIVVVVRAVASGTGNRSGIEESPLEILRKRYARGEIDEEEFNRKRRELER